MTKFTLISRKEESDNIRFEFKTETGEEIVLKIYDPDRNEDLGYPREFMTGNVIWDRDNWFAGNNLDNYGHGPGIDFTGSPLEYCEYFWNDFNSSRKSTT